MAEPNILIAGLGNVFLGDDGFGVEVARHLASRPLPKGARVIDFGIRGFDFAFALLNRPDLVILVDAAQRGFPPGTIHVLEPRLEDVVADLNGSSPHTHGMVPTRAIELARVMGAPVGTLRVVSCEPESFGEPDLGREGLTQKVARAVDEAVEIIESMVHQFLDTPCTSSR